ncbi:MAG: hypothetical protein IK066_02915, partial [Kiritimatiellae bacterium]|nr:hypothetical protein [Kiritimatiellia bacterium]
MKVIPVLRGIWARARGAAAVAALAAAGVAGTAREAAADLTINGTNVNAASSSGTGWTCSDGALTFTGEGPFTVSGTWTPTAAATVATNCTIVASGLMIDAVDTANLSGLTVNPNCTLTLTLEGENVFRGGANGAGLEVPEGATVAISGDGSLQAGGGTQGAGIGSSSGRAYGTIGISGGTIAATGGQYAAGIGSGAAGRGGTVNITGGDITATGGDGSAGIGGGCYAPGGTVLISGGTVHPAGQSGAAAIGNGWQADTSFTNIVSTNIITGGSIFADRDAIIPFPSNATPARVFPVTVNVEMSPNVDVVYATVVSESFGETYGIQGVHTDDRGNVVLWLPGSDDTYTISLSVGGGYYRCCKAVFPNGDVRDPDVFIINGTRLVGGLSSSGTGWSYSNRVVTLTGDASAFSLQGNAPNGDFRFEVPGDIASLTLDGVNLVAPDRKYGSVFAISGNAPIHLNGTNVLVASGSYAAGIEVANNATVTIDGTGSLEARGGKYGAGIGSRGGNAPCGFVTIESGTVTATGGDNAAGIGGGGNSNLQAGSIEIAGGTVTGNGGDNAAGIGAGKGNFRVPDGAVRISGGTVTACGVSGSDFVNSLGNTVSLVGGGDYKPTVVTGGNVVPGALGTVSPRPVDESGDPLYRILMGGFEAGSQVQLAGGDLPPDYASDGLFADAGGRVCLWLPATNRARVLMAGDKYYATPSPFDADADFAEGSDVPPDHVDPDDPQDPILWRVTVPELAPGAQVVLDIDAETKVLISSADSQGRFFFYVADGRYLFKANDLGYAVVVDGAPATAVRVDPDHPTGVFVNGEDIFFGIGDGWSYDSVSCQLILDSDGLIVSGSNTDGRVQVLLATNLSVTASNLTLAATNEAAAILVPDGVSATLVLVGANALLGGENHAALEVPGGAALSIEGDGALSATGGASGAGIGSGASGRGGAISIAGGTIAANGGDNAAGIGGGDGGMAASVSISGGTVTATGGTGGAGIGGGSKYQDGDFAVSVSGGLVTATGGSNAAGIGGGALGVGGDIAISGGTVHPSGQNGAADIGDGAEATSSKSNTFTGGAVFTDADRVRAGAADAHGDPVWPVTVPGLEPNGRISGLAVSSLAGVPAAYGTNDLFTSDSGEVVLWLPDDTYRLAVNGLGYAAIVDGAATTAFPIDRAHPTGVFVDGIDVCEGLARGWTYDCSTSNLVLAADGFVLSGSNTHGRVQVSLATNLTVTASNLTLAATNQAAAILVPGGVSATLVLAGENALWGGPYHAALEVSEGAALSIEGDGALSAAGGNCGPGIGGPAFEMGGDISISGGTIAAQGGNFAAGIGGGDQGKAASVTISGGTVTAVGGDRGPGIGGGPDYPDGDFTVGVSGGFVTATGGNNAAGIGGGAGGAGGDIAISGGTVHPSGQNGAADIGDGVEAPSSRSNIFTGGAIFTEAGKVRAAASNAADNAVWPVTVPGLEPNAAISSLAILEDGIDEINYGANDLCVSDGGSLVLWLPDGRYTLYLDGSVYVYYATVAGGPTTAVRGTGVFVDGTDVGAGGSSEGWAFDWATSNLVLSADGLVLSGTNTHGLVQVSLATNLSVTASNLTLAAADGFPAIALADGTDVKLFLAGDNTVSGGEFRAAVEVPGGAALAIDGSGRLSATGGSAGAGIGGSLDVPCGSIAVDDGTVEATGGQYAAGI